MSSKKPTLTRGGKWKKGRFDVSNSKKYVVSESGECVYRSSYEWRFMRWCEDNPNVIKWSSEPFSIKYQDLGDLGKVRNYWIDFVVEMENGDKLWIEVKPLSDVNGVNRFKKLYESYERPYDKVMVAKQFPREAKNYSKWVHAMAKAQEHGAKFQIITEKFLKS